MAPSLTELLAGGPPGPQMAGAGGCAGPVQQQPSASPLLDVFGVINRAIKEERARGFAINASQPPESTARIDAAVRSAMRAYVSAGHSDFRHLARFNDEHYVRHLVEENEDFEMVLICWGPGQISRVHNHADSHCWLTVLSGACEELRFSSGVAPTESEPAVKPRLPGVISASTPCPPLLPTGSSKVGVGQTAYINDSLGLHAVRCDDAACVPGEGSISLHVYAPPIRRVRLYETDADRVVVRAPGFTTIRGLDEEHWLRASHMSSSL